MELHPDEVVVFEGHPSWRSVLSFYFIGLLAALAVGAIVWAATELLLGILAAVVALVLLFVVGMIKRSATDYMVSNQRLYIRRGILSKHVQQTRIDRVQNVNTSQSLRERLLRVGTVEFETAGTDDADFEFVGISNPDRVVKAVDRAQRSAERML